MSFSRLRRPTLRKVGDFDQEFDEYFLTKVYPCLMDGMQDLAVEVEAWSESQLDDTVAKRFNPCFYLAQHLMRNNPLFLNNAEKYRDNHVLERELKRRVLEDNRLDLIHALEETLKGSTYPILNITDVFIDVDNFLKEKGKLVKSYVRSV
jgi:hypothetical protein